MIWWSLYSFALEQAEFFLQPARKERVIAFHWNKQNRHCSKSIPAPNSSVLCYFDACTVIPNYQLVSFVYSSWSRRGSMISSQKRGGAGHAQVTPVHLASAMLPTSPESSVRVACVGSRSYSLQHKELHLCLDVTLGRCHDPVCLAHRPDVIESLAFFTLSHKRIKK